MTALLVAVGAAVGASLRYYVATVMDGRTPYGTLLVNVLGSGLLGVLLGIDPSSDSLALVGTGFCGAFTTYSAFALQTHDLGPRRGAGYAAVTIGLCLTACIAGYAVSGR